MFSHPTRILRGKIRSDQGLGFEKSPSQYPSRGQLTQLLKAKIPILHSSPTDAISPLHSSDTQQNNFPLVKSFDRICVDS